MNSFESRDKILTELEAIQTEITKLSQKFSINPQVNQEEVDRFSYLIDHLTKIAGQLNLENE